MAVIGCGGYVRPAAFTADQLIDAHRAFLDYFTAVSGDQAGYPLACWNYLSAVGSSQIHGPLQIYIGDQSGNTFGPELAVSDRYFREHQRCYWDDLLAAEQDAAKRFIGRGKHTAWLTGFVSRSVLSDVVAVFPGSFSRPSSIPRARGVRPGAVPGAGLV